MRTFNNLADIEKYVKQNIKTVKLSNGKTMEQIIKEEAERLAKIIRKKIGEMYLSYSPTVYERTMDLINSLQVDSVVTKNGELSIRVYFDDSANKPSVFNDPKYHGPGTTQYDDGYTAVLMNFGWRVGSGWHRDIEGFGYRQGSRFVEQGIEEWQKGNHIGLNVMVRVNAPGITGEWNFNP